MKIFTLPFGQLLVDPETQIEQLFVISKNRKILELLINYVKYTGFYSDDNLDYHYIFDEEDQITKYLHQIRERDI